jgi:hypothetical protein
MSGPEAKNPSKTAEVSRRFTSVRSGVRVPPRPQARQKAGFFFELVHKVRQAGGLVPDNLHIAFQVAETGQTIQQNAEIKALAYCEQIGSANSGN